MSDCLLVDVRREIVAVHDFIAAWFRGEADEEAFNASLAWRLAPALVNIQPAGRTLTRDELVAGIRNGYGANPAFRIEIGDVRIIAHARDIVTAMYVERQFGARNTTPANHSRISTVLLERVAERIRWLHIHETAMPLARN